MDVCCLLLALCGREEVAINASALAEGDVDVDACHGSFGICHSDDRREEDSRNHKVGVTEILRFALNDIVD